MRRVTLARTLVLPLILLPMLAAGCGDDNDTPTAPTTPAPTFTETFSGTVSRNGATSHPFAVQSAAGGDVTATLKTVTPDAASVVGMSLGTWNGTACQAIISNDRATVSSAILGRATTTGTLCVRIFDVGALTNSQDYEVEVVHP